MEKVVDEDGATIVRPNPKFEPLKEASSNNDKTTSDYSITKIP